MHSSSSKEQIQTVRLSGRAGYVDSGSMRPYPSVLDCPGSPMRPQLSNRSITLQDEALVSESLRRDFSIPDLSASEFLSSLTDKQSVPPEEENGQGRKRRKHVLELQYYKLKEMQSRMTGLQAVGIREVLELLERPGAVVTMRRNLGSKKLGEMGADALRKEMEQNAGLFERMKTILGDERTQEYFDGLLQLERTVAAETRKTGSGEIGNLVKNADKIHGKLRLFFDAYSAEKKQRVRDPEMQRVIRFCVENARQSEQFDSSTTGVTCFETTVGDDETVSEMYTPRWPEE